MTAATSERDLSNMTSMMFMLGLIFWGNLIDNSLNPKNILLLCEAFIAFIYLTYAIFSFLLQDSVNVKQSFIRHDFEIDVIMSNFRSGIMIVTAIQLFNWFPKKVYGLVLSVTLLCSPLAFFLEFVIGGFYDCFPDMPYYELNKDVKYPIDRNSTQIPNSPENWCGYNYNYTGN
jgi:hypothetical protein